MYEMGATDRVATEAVARWIAGFDAAVAPPEAAACARLVLLDTLGVMVGSTRHEVGRAVLAGAAALSADGSVLAPGSGAALDVATGALVYGTLGHGIELDEVHLPSRQHAGATTLGAALALGQHLDCDLAQVLDALLVGYEVAGHLGIAVDNNVLLDRNFHLSGIVSAFGCCAVAARLLALDAGTVYQALGLTASQACGTLAWHTEPHHMSKSLQCGFAARNGVTAALLAQRGCGGPEAVFAGPYNYFLAFRGSDPRPGWHEGLGQHFEILNTSMKLYAAGRPMHAAIDALLDLMREHALGAGDIEALAVHMPPGAARIVDGNPTRSIDCASVMAAAALDGCFGLAQAEGERMNRADVQALRRRVSVVHDPALDPHFPRSFPATVRLLTRGGRTLEQTVIAATGERERPMTGEALRDKFHGLADPVIGHAAAGRVADLALAPGQASTRELARLLAPGRSTQGAD